MSRPGKRSPMTSAVHRAHANIMRSFELADAKHASIPLMHETTDPRTQKSHDELYQDLVRKLRSDKGQSAGFGEPSGAIVYDRPAKITKKPAKPLKGRHMSDRGGYPVDPAKGNPLEQASVGDGMSNAGAEFDAM